MLTKEQRAAYRVRVHRAKKPKSPTRQFHSTMIPYSSIGRTITRNLSGLAKECWAYKQDDLKCPMWQWNDAKPALLSVPAFNIYFGANVAKTRNTLERPAYGFGTGSSTIGLNPRTMRINPIFPTMAKFMAKITDVMEKQRPEWKDSLDKFPINFCGFKAYFSVRIKDNKWERKSCEWHRDVTHTNRGKPLQNNTQIPGTPVFILTYGDEKSLRFQKYSGNQRLNIPEIVFPQKHGSLFLLDPRDEKTDDLGEFWKHMSDMNRDESITFSFTFRSVAKTVEVTNTGKLATPQNFTHKKKDAKFNNAKHLMEGKQYAKRVAEINERVIGFLNNFKP